MKKSILSLALILAAASASAQFYVGAGLNFSSDPSTTSKTETTVGGITTTVENTGSSFSAFSFSPEVGYTFSDKFCAGIAVSFGTSTVDDEVEVSASDPMGTVTTATNWSIFPYAQYYYLSFGKVNAYLKAGPVFGGSSSSPETEVWNGSAVVPSNTTIENKSSSIGFVVIPGIDFKISEKFTIYTSLNFMSLSYFALTEKSTETNKTIDYEEIETEKSSSFDFGVNSANIANVGGITFGAYYNF